MTSTEVTPPPLETDTSPSAVTPSHVASSPVSIPPPRHNQSQRSCLIALFVVIGLPLIVLAYQLIKGALYSPASQYKRDEAKVSDLGAKAKQKFDSQLSLIDAELFKLAPDIPPTTPKLTSVKRNDVISEIQNYTPVKGELSRNGNKITQHVCQAVALFSGSKFNEHEIGQRMSCSYGVEQIYKWTGDQDSLQQLMKKASQSLQLVEGEKDYDGVASSYRLRDDEKPTISVDYSTIAPSYQRMGLIKDSPIWQKVFENTEYSPSPDTSKGQWLTVILKTEYYVFFDTSPNHE